MIGAGPIDSLRVGRATVVFGDTGRPEATTHIRLESFDGPLGLLVGLIEARQLDILSVPLGVLAEAYLDALANLDVDRMGNVSAFVAVAGQLILIKSRAMLPQRASETEATVDEGPDPEAELRARLLLYRAFRDAGTRLEAGMLATGASFRREPAIALAAGKAGARAGPPGPPLDSEQLVASLMRLASVQALPSPRPQGYSRTMTMDERVEVILAALRGVNGIVLQELLAGVKDRVVIAVTFLAMLELVKRRSVVVEQDEPWGPIVIRMEARGPEPAS